MGAGGSGAEVATAPVARPAALHVLASRDFWPYFAGSTLSNVGTWFQNLAAALLVFQLTGSSFLVGLVNFGQFIGALVLAPWAGGAADRFDRRRLLITTQLGAALVAASLALATHLGLVTAPLVVVAAFGIGLALAFMVPAMLALVPLLVPRRDLDAAVALNSITFNLARAVGPVLATAVIAAVGYAAAFSVNALSFLALVAALLMVRPRHQQRQIGARPKLRESLTDVRREPVWRALLVVVAAVSVSTDPVHTLTPEFAQEVLGLGEAGVGYLVGAFGTGATLTAVLLPGWLRRRRNALVGAMLVQGGGMLLFATATTLPVALGGMAVSGGGFIAANVRATTRLQQEVPDAKLGRVMALWSIAFIGSRPFAALVDGAVAELLGARSAGVVMALPTLLGAAWAARVISRMRAATAAEAHSAGGGSSVAR